MKRARRFVLTKQMIVGKRIANKHADRIKFAFYANLC